MASRPPRYGAPITLEEAKQVMAAAEAEANRNEWPMVIAITDNAGRLVMLHRLDDAQNGSIIIAQEKARTAVDFKRPTKALQDAIAQGGMHLRLLRAPNALPMEGGIPIIRNGEIIGEIGVSGMSSDHRSPRREWPRSSPERLVLEGATACLTGCPRAVERFEGKQLPQTKLWNAIAFLASPPAYQGPLHTAARESLDWNLHLQPVSSARTARLTEQRHHYRTL